MEKIVSFLAVVGFLFLCKIAYDAYRKHIPDPVKPYWNAYESILQIYSSCHYIQNMLNDRRISLKNYYKERRRLGHSPDNFHPFTAVRNGIPEKPLNIPGAARAWAACQIILDINQQIKLYHIHFSTDEYKLLESILKEQIKYLAAIVDDPDDPLNNTLFYYIDDLTRYSDICPESLKKKK